jgi:hypothetical protein
MGHGKHKTRTEVFRADRDINAMSFGRFDANEIERGVPRAVTCDDRLGAFAHMCFDDEQLGLGTTMLHHPGGP